MLEVIIEVPWSDELARMVAKRILYLSKENIKKMDLIASGELYDSGEVLQYGPGEWAVVYSMPYAQYLEFGTRPHNPPIEPLVEWLMVKYHINDTEARKRAWAIAKKIAKYGTPSRPFLRNAVDQVEKEMNFRFSWQEEGL